MLSKYSTLNNKQLGIITGGRGIHIWGWIKAKISGSWY